MGSQTNKRTFAMKQVLSYKNLNESGACISSSPFCLIRFSNNWKNGGVNSRDCVEAVMSRVNMIRNNCTFL